MTSCLEVFSGGCLGGQPGNLLSSKNHPSRWGKTMVRFFLIVGALRWFWTLNDQPVRQSTPNHLQRSHLRIESSKGLVTDFQSKIGFKKPLVKPLLVYLWKTLHNKKRFWLRRPFIFYGFSSRTVWTLNLGTLILYECFVCSCGQPCALQKAKLIVHLGSFKSPNYDYYTW